MEKLKNGFTKFQMQEALRCNDSIIEASTKLYSFCDEFNISTESLKEHLEDKGYKFVDDDYYCIILDSNLATCFLYDLEDEIFEFIEK